MTVRPAKLRIPSCLLPNRIRVAVPGDGSAMFYAVIHFRDFFVASMRALPAGAAGLSTPQYNA